MNSDGKILELIELVSARLIKCKEIDDRLGVLVDSASESSDVIAKKSSEIKSLKEDLNNQMSELKSLMERLKIDYKKIFEKSR